MTKRIISVVLLIVTLLATVSCREGNKEEIYTENWAPSLGQVTMFKEDVPVENDAKMMEEFMGMTSEPTKAQKEIIQNVKEKVEKYYGSGAEDTRIICGPIKKLFPQGNVVAFYIEALNTIVLSENFDESGQAYLFHEFLHAYSNNGVKYEVEHDGKHYMMGEALNEGVTNMFGVEAVSHNKEDVVYEYQTHSAKEMAILFGKEKMWNSYAEGNVEAIRSEFNKIVSNINFYFPKQEDIKEDILMPIEFTAFDVYINTLEETCLLIDNCDYYIEEYGADEVVNTISRKVSSMEEMMLNVGILTGKKDELQSEMQDFIDNSEIGGILRKSSKIVEISNR